MNSDVQAIEIDNRVSDTDARKQAVDQALRAAFDGVPGDWKVTVSEVGHFSPLWWWVTVQGQNHAVETSVRPSEQNAEAVRRRVADILRQPPNA